MPEVFQVVVRVVRADTPIDVRWDGPNQLVMTTTAYRGNFLLSSDLRTFDTPLRVGMSVSTETPLGAVTANASDHMARVALRLSPDAQRERIHFFYYSDGRIQALDPLR